MSTHALTVFTYSPTEQRFIPKTTQRALGDHEVLIKTTHSGLCFTDVHAKPKGCGLGHEGVGTVTRAGRCVPSAVLAPGDRVGWGWLHSSCGGCRAACAKGYRQYCAAAAGFAYSDLDQGAFGDYRIIDAAFAYRIPDAIDSAHAAPLMCAGASVYEALDAAGVATGDRVGVLGVGGLGHVALLFARAMGCATSAILAAPREPPALKVRDAFELGADDVRCVAEGFEVVYRRGEDGEVVVVEEEASGPRGGDGNKMDVLLVTSNELPADWGKVLPLLGRMARIVLMTIQQTERLSVPYMPFILPGHRIIASTEASKRNHVEMLEFAARHSIKPWIERFPMTEEGLEAAFRRLEQGEMRYRGVLEW